MRFTLIIIFTLFISGKAFSQGMDWQFSSRMPSKSPIYFVGISGSFDYISHRSDFVIKENVNHAKTPEFDRGVGRGFNVNIHGEYWFKPELALFADLGFVNQPGTFFSGIETLPISDTMNIRGKYGFDSEYKFIQLAVGAKRKILNSNFYIGASLNFRIFIDSSMIETDILLSPIEKKVSLIDPEFPEIRALSIMPVIRTGYDFSVGAGRYADVYLSLGLPLMSMASSYEWRNWTFSAGMALNIGALSE